jgi:hypothetical protein
MIAEELKTPAPVRGVSVLRSLPSKALLAIEGAFDEGLQIPTSPLPPLTPVQIPVPAPPPVCHGLSRHMSRVRPQKSPMFTVVVTTSRPWDPVVQWSVVLWSRGLPRTLLLRIFARFCHPFSSFRFPFCLLNAHCEAGRMVHNCTTGGAGIL